MQLKDYETPDAIFQDYAYFSSYSQSWLEHADQYVKTMMREYPLGINSQVIEIASNDGYLLQYFKKEQVPVLGIEPARNVARVAIEKGIPSISEFFGEALATMLAAEGTKADLLLGNNVLAHVPNINDFVKGMKILLKSEGVITMEFPHLLKLTREVQFDTIYHEHFSYLSLTTVQKYLMSMAFGFLKLWKLILTEALSGFLQNTLKMYLCQLTKAFISCLNKRSRPDY